MKPYAHLLLGTMLIISAPLAAQTPDVMSGGVGMDDRARIEALQSRYNTKFVFSGEGGDYLADVHVSIQNKDGTEVLAAQSEGPIMLVQLEAGRYLVEVSAEGFSDKRHITVGKNTQTYHFRLPVKDVQE